MFKPLHSGVLVQPEVTEEKKTKSGLIVAHSIFDDFDKLKATSAFGKVISVGRDCEYLRIGDRVIYAKNSEWMKHENNLFFKEEKNILARINEDGTYDCHPDFCIVKIKKEDRDGLFSKWITRDDGSRVELFVNVPAESDDERASKFFVQTGTVVKAGSNVTSVCENDIGVVDYNVDNDENVVVGYDGDDKIVVVFSVTTRHLEDDIVYANRRTPRDVKVSVKGDYDIVSQLLGVVRGEKLISIDPFVFIDHRSSIIQMKTKSGILYEEKQKSIQREVLSVSDNSKERFNISQGKNILVMENDVFDVVVHNKKISCVNDCDVLCSLRG